MTINVHCPRLGDRERRLFELISSMYPGSPWYKHIAVVWTRCYSLMADQIEKWKSERKAGFIRFLEKYFTNEISKEQANSIPHYFVDSVEARQNNSPSNNELCYLLAWAGQLKTIKEELPTIKVKVGNPIVETRSRVETGGTWDETWDEKRGGVSGFFGGKRQRGKKYQNQTTIYEEREKQEFTDGSVEYTDWRETKRDSRQVVIDRW